MLARDNGTPGWFVLLFALLHDCCRLNEQSDPEHGPRGARFARELQGSLFTLPPWSLDDLLIAIEGHTKFVYNAIPDVQVCWDSDRLDLARCGKIPDVTYLGTAAAQQEHVRKWATKRALARHQPRIFHPDVLPRISLKRRLRPLAEV